MNPENRAKRISQNADQLQIQYLQLLNNQNPSFNTNRAPPRNLNSVILEGRSNEIQGNGVHKEDILNDMEFFWTELIPAVAYEMFPTRVKSGGSELEKLVQYYIKKSLKITHPTPHFSNVSRKDLIESKLLKFKNHCVGCFPNPPPKGLVPCKFPNVIPSISFKVG